MKVRAGVSGSSAPTRCDGNLREVLRDLPQIHSAVVVAVAALRQQASELDEDVALVLQRGAADRIQDQVEKLEAALALMADIA